SALYTARFLCLLLILLIGTATPGKPQSALYTARFLCLLLILLIGTATPRKPQPARPAAARSARSRFSATPSASA
ncbi:hypothetical protein, partial [Haloparvum sedimenti]|uniref:hypothetical protein n=1 Tax=Haloparvum sedimenti TaxID=1678448 RepID=UPI001C40032E